MPKKGQFKGWLPGKSFGFIVAEELGQDVFVHKGSVNDSTKMTPGSLVTFEVEETPRGIQAKDVQVTLRVTGERREKHPDYPDRRQGRVKHWSDQGFGFIETADGGQDVFIHGSRLPATEGGFLHEGSLIEFDTSAGSRGPEAFSVNVVGWEPTGNPLSDFADMGSAAWLTRLKELAEEEAWEYRHTPSSQPLPILRSYIRYTFHRLSEMSDGISYSRDEQQACFNTGLVTPNQEEIFGIFVKNQKAGRQPWRLGGFHKASDRAFINAFGGNPPPLAEYFDNPADLLFDRRCELYISIDHVLERIDRFPAHLRTNEFLARQLLLSAEAQTKKRVYRNYKTAIPQFFRSSGGAGKLQLLLPICLESPAKADLALTVEKSESGDAYRSSTVLTLDMAYNNARLLARPDTEWLQP